MRKGTTHMYQNHQPCAAAAILCSTIPEFNNRFFINIGGDCISKLLTQIIEWEGVCIEHLKENQKNMAPLTGDKLTRHEQSTECCICHKNNRPFIDGDTEWRKVADHDHVTGYYLGAAHDLCNRLRRVCFEIPVFFHNFRGYDGHLIVQSFNEHPQRSVTVIGQTMEKYLQVQWGENIVFRDSLQFLKGSLQQLTDSLLKAGGSERFKHLAAAIHPTYGIQPNVDPEFDLLLRKGVFPYEFLNSFEKLNATELPPIEDFYSSLRDEEITHVEYEHAQNVWRSFNMVKFEEYLKLYLITDVGILADVFDDFRNNCQQGYQLDPAYFVSGPHLAWNAMLKQTKAEIELISDPEMYRMVHPNIRGGICHASVRYARANNKYMGGLYDPQKPSSYIFYIDATNLYGWAMTQCLPHSKFKWLSDNEIREAEAALMSESPNTRNAWFDTTKYFRRLAQLDQDVENGAITAQEANDMLFGGKHYFLEVDLEYPIEIHDRDDDYPLAPEIMEVTASMHSEKHLELIRKYYGRSAPFSKKLVCSLLPKKNYLVLGELLQFYLNRGMKITKIHRGIKFDTQQWINPYIEYNTQQRHIFKDDETKKAFFKSMNLTV